MKYCVTGREGDAADRARQILKDAELPIPSTLSIESFVGRVQREMTYDTQHFFKERSSRIAPVTVPTSVLSEFPQSPTCQRLLGACGLVKEANSVPDSSNLEDKRQYLQYIVNAYLMCPLVLQFVSVDFSRVSSACDDIEKNFSSVCEDALIGREITRSTIISPEHTQEGIDRMLEAIRLMELRNMSDKSSQLKLARLHCLAGDMQCLRDQYVSALDHFSQAEEMRTDDIAAVLSGQAFCHSAMVGQLEQAKHLYLEYFRKAPKCDAAFARNCYFLAAVSLKLGKWQDFCYYYEQGIEHEMDRLPFQAAVNTQAKHCLLGLYIVADTTEMSFCINCSRIETFDLISTCSCCSPIVSYQFTDVSERISRNRLKVALKRSKIEVVTVSPVVNSVRKVMAVLKSIEEKFCRVNRLIEMTKKSSNFARSSQKPLVVADAFTSASKLSGAEIENAAVKGADKARAGSYFSTSGRNIEDTNFVDVYLRCLVESLQGNVTHAVKKGAAGTLFAANLCNPSHTTLKEVLSTAKDIALRNDPSIEVTGATTFAESGASGRVAISVTCKSIPIHIYIISSAYIISIVEFVHVYCR